MDTSMTIQSGIVLYLDSRKKARSANTYRTYHNALSKFSDMLAERKDAPVDSLNEEILSEFCATLKEYSVATERLYLTAALQLYKFVARKGIKSMNVELLEGTVADEARKAGKRLIQFPEDTIDKLIAYAESLPLPPAGTTFTDRSRRLTTLRDRAFIVTLADTGLRVHEACGLRRGDLDPTSRKAVIIGKGNKQAVVRFSTRAVDAIVDYLKERQSQDGAQGVRRLADLPLFARHDPGAKRAWSKQGMTTTTGRNIVAQRLYEAVGSEVLGHVSPHAFRHYFVTQVLRKSGGNLKVACELARHSTVGMTERYAHLADVELDADYDDMFQ